MPKAYTGSSRLTYMDFFQFCCTSRAFAKTANREYYIKYLTVSTFSFLFVLRHIAVVMMCLLLACLHIVVLWKESRLISACISGTKSRPTLTTRSPIKTSKIDITASTTRWRTSSSTERRRQRNRKPSLLPKTRPSRPFTSAVWVT